MVEAKGEEHAITPEHWYTDPTREDGFIFTSKQTVVCCVLVASSMVLLPPLSPDASGSVDHFQEGLEWYGRRAEQGGGTTADPGPINKAIEHFQQKLQSSPSDARSALFLLKSYYYKSTYVPMASKQSRKILARGKRLGQRMVDEYPHSVPLKFWYAINLGRWAEEYGLIAAAREGVPGEMRQLCNEIIRLNHQYKKGGVFGLLGQVHFKTPYIPLFLTWSSNERSIENFQEALKIGANKPQVHYYYAVVLEDERRTQESLSQLRKVIDMKTRDDMRIEDRRTKSKARELIEELTT